MSIGIGIIGAGVMGADHARTIATSVAGARLVAVSDADIARAKASSEASGATRVYQDGLDLIRDDEVDAVLVASPDHTHAGFVLACLAAGKPVLCEKPLAATRDECLRLVKAEADHGKRKIQVGFMRRFDPFYADMRGALRSGKLGKALLMHCAHRNVGAPGFFTPEMSITNAAVHEFDVIRWMLDDDIVAVTTLRSAAKGDGTLRDPLMLLLETAGGVLADVEVFINASYGYDIRTELVCETGTIDLARPRPAEIRASGAQGLSFPPDWRGRFSDAYRLQLQAWVNSYGSEGSDGRSVGASTWDGYVATMVAEAALASLASGERTEIRLAERPALYGSS